MNRNTRIGFVLGGGIMFILATAIVPIFAGDQPEKAAAREKKSPPGKEMTLVGKIVDLQNYMSGQYSSDDKAKCTADAIKAGVPVAIESATGMVVIGEGSTSPSKTFAPLAMKRVQITGKFYEKGGLKYIDVANAREATVDPKDVEEVDE